MNQRANSEQLLLLEIERKAFTDFAAKFGVDPDDLAKHIMAEQEKRLNVWFSNPTGSSKTEISETGDHFKHAGYSVTDLLDYQRSLASQDIKGCAQDLVVFASKHWEQFGIDWERLRKQAIGRSLSSDAEDWPVQYLCNAPLVLLFDPDIEASVRYFSNTPYRVVLSRSLDGLIDGLLPPIIIRYLFPTDLDGSENVFVIRRATEPPFDLASSAAALVALGYWILNPFDKKGIIELQREHPALMSIRTMKGLLEALVMQMYWGAYDFVLLHELSHILLGHDPRLHNKADEAQADILAYNAMLHSERAGYDLLWTRRMTALLPFRALGPIALMRFLSVLNGLKGWFDPHSHPHPNTRAAYLTLIAGSILKQNPSAQFSLTQILKPFDELFDAAYDVLEIPDGFNRSLDLAYLDGFRLPWVAKDMKREDGGENDSTQQQPGADAEKPRRSG